MKPIATRATFAKARGQGRTCISVPAARAGAGVVAGGTLLLTTAAGGRKGFGTGVVLLGAMVVGAGVGATTARGAGDGTAGTGEGLDGAAGNGAATGTPIKARSGAVSLPLPDPFVSPGVITATICTRGHAAPSGSCTHENQCRQPLHCRIACEGCLRKRA